MNQSTQNKHNSPNSQHSHSAMLSYVIGFLLSLVFTASAYYLVVSKTVSGPGLLATILGIAILQMAVQIFFFLHLGRGPKPLYNVIFFVSTIAIILVVLAGSLIITNNLKYNTSVKDVTTKLAEGERISQVGGTKTGACPQIGANHRVAFSKGKVSPVITSARQCDTLTFINIDDAARVIAFGPHLQHQFYGGETEQTVRTGYSKTITLNQSGTYLFHDHTEPGVSGDLTVTP